MKECLDIAILRQKVYEDDTNVIIEDIRPAADLHLLVLPKRHIRDITTVDDAKILDSLLLTARAHLQNYDVMEDKNVGFHQPPFNSQVFTRNKLLFLRII